MTYFYCVHEKGGHYGGGAEHYWHAGITSKKHFLDRSRDYEYCVYWENLGVRDNARKFEETCRVFIPWIFAEHCVSWSCPVDWKTQSFREWHSNVTNMILWDGTFNLYGCGFFRYHENYPVSIQGEALGIAFDSLVKGWRDGSIPWLNQRTYSFYGAGRRAVIDKIRSDLLASNLLQAGIERLKSVILESASQRLSGGIKDRPGAHSESITFSLSREHNLRKGPKPGEIEPEGYFHLISDNSIIKSEWSEEDREKANLMTEIQIEYERKNNDIRSKIYGI